MSMEWKKLKSLLKFYKKNKVEIELKVDVKDGLIVRGFIIKNNYLFIGGNCQYIQIQLTPTLQQRHQFHLLKVKI